MSACKVGAVDAARRVPGGWRAGPMPLCRAETTRIRPGQPQAGGLVAEGLRQFHGLPGEALPRARRNSKALSSQILLPAFLDRGYDCGALCPRDR